MKSLAAYLQRIALASTPKADLATLALVMAAQSRAIPFENYDVVMKKTISMARSDVEDKLVSKARGGYCWEQNTLLQMALESIGFTVTPLMCRVRWNKPDDTAEHTTAYTHMALKVETEAGPHLADVGFAGTNSMAPVRIFSDSQRSTAEPQSLPEGMFRIADGTHPQYNVLQLQIKGHETINCPRPAHYQCGPAPPPTPPPTPPPLSGPGSKIWSFPTVDKVRSSPAVSSDGKVVYVGSYDFNLYAVDAVTGGKIWSFQTGDRVTSSPAVSRDGTVVYVGSYDSNLYAVDAVNGSKIWSFPTGYNVVQSSPAVSRDGKVVYVGSGDYNLYAVDAVNGSKIWSFPTGAAVDSSPAVSRDGTVVYVGSYDSNLYAVDVVNGSKIWSFPTGYNVVQSSPAVSSDGKVVYVGSEDNNLYAVDA